KSLGASVSLKNKKLVDENTKEVSNNLKSWKKMGKFIIFEDYGPKWDLMVLVSLLDLIEKQRRKRGSAMFPGGAGSGPLLTTRSASYVQKLRTLVLAYTTRKY